MDRRAFFKRSIDKVSKTAVEIADGHVSRKAKHWIRPPYAVDELEFLLACTRCDQCIDACPHDVIFNLPTRLGAQVAGTPAMDLLNKACHLCEDWPCVETCEPKALQYPTRSSEMVEESDEKPIPLPQIAHAEINTKICLPYNGPECGACAASCPVPDALCWDGTRPFIDPEKCTGCGLCREICIVEPKAIDIQSL